MQGQTAMDSDRDEVIIQRIVLEAQATRTEMRQGFARLEARMDEDRAENRVFQKRTQETFTQILLLLEILRKQDELASQRLDNVDNRLDSMDNRLEDMDQRLDGMDQRLDERDR